MKRYTIVHCLTHMCRGGAETFIMNVLRNIDLEKYKICFLLATDEGDYIKEIKERGCEIYTIGTRREGITYYKRLKNFFKYHAGEIDVLHYHTSSLSSIEVLWFAKMYGIRKRIIHSHNTNQKSFVHKSLHYLTKPLVRFAATDYLSCSELAADWMFNNTGVRNKVKVLNNGIDLQVFTFDPEIRKEKRRELGIADSTLVVMHVGRFCHVKNHEFLVKIFNNLLSVHSDSVLIMIGRGETESNIRKQVDEYNISDKVIFAGVQENVAIWLQAADVFVFPSFYEGLPVALVEAQATGLPVICSANVSEESKLTPNFDFLKLEEPLETWTTHILFMHSLARESGAKYIENKGYSIKSTVNKLITEIY